MRRVIVFVVGFLTFLAAHAIEAARWTTWFQGTFDPWFLNAGRAAAFTLGCIGAASFIVAWRNASPPGIRGVTLAAGACVAMTMVLFLKPGGAGTIFPIAIVAGGVFILMASTLAAWMGREVRGVLKGR